MTDLEKAARQALETLENVRKYDGENLYGLDDEIIALRQALEQPANEPVAWVYESTCGQDFATPFEPPIYAKNVRPLYTRPHSQAICENYSQAAAIRARGESK